LTRADLVHWMKLCPRRLFKFPGGRAGGAAPRHTRLVDIERAWLGTPGTLWVCESSLQEFGTFDLAAGTFEGRGSQGLVEVINDSAELVGSMQVPGPLGAALVSRPGQPIVNLNNLIAPGGNRRIRHMDALTRVTACGCLVDPTSVARPLRRSREGNGLDALTALEHEVHRRVMIM
jgi:hypothetical protein